MNPLSRNPGSAPERTDYPRDAIGPKAARSSISIRTTYSTLWISGRGSGPPVPYRSAHVQFSVSPKSAGHGLIM